MFLQSIESFIVSLCLALQQMSFHCIVISLIFNTVHTSIEKKRKSLLYLLILEGILCGKENKS